MTSYARIKFPAGFWTGLHQLGISSHEVVRKAGLPLTIINEPVVTAPNISLFGRLIPISWVTLLRLLSS